MLQFTLLTVVPESMWYLFIGVCSW